MEAIQEPKFHSLKVEVFLHLRTHGSKYGPQNKIVRRSSTNQSQLLGYIKTPWNKCGINYTINGTARVFKPFDTSKTNR